MEGKKAKGKSERPEDAVVSVNKGAGKDEEQQMEEFCILLRNVREMREEWRRCVGGEWPAKRPKVEGFPWTPTFQWEDFRGVEGLAKIPEDKPGTSKVEGSEKEQKEEDTSLDLNLSL